MIEVWDYFTGGEIELRTGVIVKVFHLLLDNKFHCLFIYLFIYFSVSNLLDKGADPNISNADGLTPLHKVREGERERERES